MERFGGVNWSNDRHAVCVVDPDGHVVDEFDIADTGDGLTVMCRHLTKAGVRRTASNVPTGRWSTP